MAYIDLLIYPDGSVGSGSTVHGPYSDHWAKTQYGPARSVRIPDANTILKSSQCFGPFYEAYPTCPVTPQLPVTQPVDPITGLSNSPATVVSSYGGTSENLIAGNGVYNAGNNSTRISIPSDAAPFAPGTVINGNAGNDVITGSMSDRNITYRGGQGNDEIGAGVGDIYGDRGADAFRPMGSGTNEYARVLDYTPGEDVFLGTAVAGGEFKVVNDGLMFYSKEGEQMMLLVGIGASEVTYL